MNEWMNEWTYAKHNSTKNCHKFKRSCLMRLFKTGRQLTPMWKGWEQQVPFHTVRKYTEGKHWLRRDLIQTELTDTSPTNLWFDLGGTTGASARNTSLRDLASAAKQLRNELWAIMQRVVVTAFRRFKTTDRFQLQGYPSPPPKKKELYYGVYIKCRRWKILVAWCQPRGLMKVAGVSGSVVNQCYFEARPWGG